jgi:hypothetical protein
MRVKMKASKDCGGFSIQGVEVEMSKKGVIEIDAQHVETAKSHGFLLLADAKNEPDAPAGGDPANKQDDENKTGE